MDRQPADEAKTTPINLQNVLADAKREAAGEQVGAVALADFIDLVFGRIPPEELGRRTADHIAFSAASLLRFTSVADPARQPARAKLAITPVDNRRAGVPAHTAIEVNAPDRPFIIASLLGELRAQGHSVDLLVHPILWTERDASGSLQRIVAAGAGANGALNQESVVRIEIEPLADQSALDRLEAGLTATLQDLDAAVTDWPAMRDALQAAAQGLSEVNAPDTKNDLQEARHFVDWLLADNFILLGMRDYRLTPGNGAATLTVVPDRSLGILRDSDRRIVHNEGTKAEAPPSSAPLFVAKSTLRSRIHRPAHLDFISLRSYSATGDVVGECRFVGLFTATAYNQSVATIPLLRRKADAVIAASGIDTPGHDQNVLRNIVETYPRDELFQIDGETLSRIAIGIMRLGDRPRPRLFLRRDPYDRFASILVYIPRDRFSSAMRELVGQNLAEAQHGRVSAFYTELGDQPLTRVQFIIGLDPGTGPRPDEADLEALLVDTVRSWRDGLKDALDAALPEAQAAAHYAAYAGAFPAAYQEAHTAEKAVRDILDLESMAEGEETLFRCLASTPENPRSTIAIRIFRRGSPVPLSDIVPVMENMGLRIISEAPFKLRPGLERSSTSEVVYLHDFCALPAGKQADGPIEISEETARSVEETLSRVWRGEAENDGFNALAFDADLTWDEITLIRALAKYRLQAGSAFSQAYMQEAFAANPRLAQLVVAYFMALHAPDRPETKPAGPSAEALLEDIMAGLDGVESSDHDRILRLFINLVGQVRRTNLFRREAGERRPTIALKFDPTGIDELPPPHAYAEVFVYAPSVEGVHFRFGKIARGGLRWSGRREDFRTEVLGLVKAQQVKNAVIVPVGAKGGFYAKAVPAGATRDQEIAAGIDAYKLFIGGLLDLTDNLEQGNGQQQVLPPPGVSRPDGDDPYLVVAADKGTATFSDIANDVAGSYGFWLGDAFASGGSNGYDHKAMGITARGAWEAVKRHFRELGHDTQTQPFTVAGVGDMSGDVFGNGMLLSEHIQLVAAFDHRHIFIDPTPDTARSFAERQRIFALPRSSWADYDTSLISSGGGVFPRSAKRIALTDEMRRCLGTDATQLAPTELIRAVLSAPVDLLWFGGIGTYIKAEHERDFDVGDRANDQVRIDTRALRARVIGEGANLGLTQQGRVEAGRRGVALNTDAVDNSAGVDCSDHEVNIKILLDAVKREGQITDTERNDRLKAMTEDVAELVLATNYEQTLAISLAEATAVPDLDASRRLIQRFESRGVLDRALENLPSEDVFQILRERGLGLTRPEISVLFAYAKIDLYEALVGSTLSTDAVLRPRLHAYFPDALQKDFPEAIDAHTLKREIISTVLANEIVDVCGPTFINRVRENTGKSVDSVARAFVTVSAVFDVKGLRASINALDNKLPAEMQTTLHLSVVAFVRRQIIWLLGRHGAHLDPATLIADYGPGVARLVDNVTSLPGFIARPTDNQTSAFTDDAVPEALRDRLKGLGPLTPAFDLCDLARASELPITDVAEAYRAVGLAFGLDDLLHAAEQLKGGEHWDRLAIRRIIADLADHQRTLAEAALSHVSPGDSAIGETIAAWVDGVAGDNEAFQVMLDEVEFKTDVTVAKLAFAVSRLGDLVRRLAAA